MDLIADVFLAAGAFGAAFYCFVLQRRLTRFTRLENGMGGAIAVLSAQVDDLTKALKSAQVAAADSTQRLDGLTDRAEAATTRLELMLSSLHDLPGAEPAEPGAPPRRLRFSRTRRPESESAA